VVKKGLIFWDITLCSPLKFNKRFGGTYRIHLQGRGISQTRYQHEAGSKQTSDWPPAYASLVSENYLSELYPLTRESVRRNSLYFAYDDVFCAYKSKSSIFWDITPCSPLIVNRCLLKAKQKSACYLLHAGFLLGLFFDPEDRDMFPRNVDCLSTDLMALYHRR
jgi:hypothetical protein